MGIARAEIVDVDGWVCTRWMCRHNRVDGLVDGQEVRGGLCMQEKRKKEGHAVEIFTVWHAFPPRTSRTPEPFADEREL